MIKETQPFLMIEIVAMVYNGLMQVGVLNITLVDKGLGGSFCKFTSFMQN